MRHTLPGITTRDELAGVVDLFGAVTPGELADALDELAFRHGEKLAENALTTAVEEAIAEYILVEVGQEAIGIKGELSEADDHGEDAISADDSSPDRSTSTADISVSDSSLPSETPADPGSRSESDSAAHSDTDQRAVSADEIYLTVGPAAFPSFPKGAVDLPHILSIPERQVTRKRAAVAVESRLATDTVDAIESGDDARIETLLNVCFDFETWAGVDVTEIREQLETT